MRNVETYGRGIGTEKINYLGKMFTRHDWGAVQPVKMMASLNTPVHKVVTTWAGVNPCYTIEDCKQRVRDVQQRDMEQKRLFDIQHNFLIGGDGNIYEGRGWFNRGPVYPKSLQHAAELTGKCIEVGFLDHYSMHPSETLMKGGSDLVAYGLVSKYLQEKVLFYWRTANNIKYVSSYETNAPGTSNTENFYDPDNVRDKDRDELNLCQEAKEKNAKKRQGEEDEFI